MTSQAFIQILYATYPINFVKIFKIRSLETQTNVYPGPSVYSDSICDKCRQVRLEVGNQKKKYHLAEINNNNKDI